MNPAKKEAAADEVSTLAMELAHHEKERQKLYGQFSKAVMKGWEAGLTYEDLAVYAGLSRIRVAQILTNVRREREVRAERRKRAAKSA